MFREIKRKKQQVSKEECVRVLREGKRGVLSLIGDDGYPYGLPINYWYDEERNTVLFHGSSKGHKVDAMTACERASFCVWDEGYRKEGEWAYNVTSVILFGRMRVIEDFDYAAASMRKFGAKYTEDTEYIEHEIRVDGPHTRFTELVVEHMSGKLVNES